MIACDASLSGVRPRAIKADMLHKRLNACALAMLVFTLGLAGATAAEDPFTFSPPKNWRPERIPFPLGFAPDMKYRGFEELRFGPGMFQPGSKTYWSYGFFWWLEGKQKVNEATLKRDLEIYYKGLSKAVGGSRKLQLDLEKVSAKVKAAESESNETGKGIHKIRYTADLKTHDAFATGKLLELRAEISVHYFPELDRTWAWFSVAPKAADASVWKTMRTMRDSFSVRRPD